jgi:hypothetical protein
MCIGPFFLILSALVAAFGFPKQTASDVPVTTSLADFDATSTPHYVQSDGQGADQNGVNNVMSILVANGYNHIVDADWRLDLSGLALRKVGVTFDTANAVHRGDPGYTAPANPPHWGTGFEAVRMENKCSLENHDMLAMKDGDSFTCFTSIRFTPATSISFYRLDMGSLAPFPAPEAQKAQVHCNSANSGGWNDWFIDPIPLVNADGRTSPGQTRARLGSVNTRGTTSYTTEGDSYLTFHIHLTRP